MSNDIVEIEQAVQQLPAEELAKFREWFAQFDAAQWDHQIEGDVASGRLDSLADEAIDDFRKGRCKDVRGTEQARSPVTPI